MFVVISEIRFEQTPLLPVILLEISCLFNVLSCFTMIVMFIAMMKIITNLE